MNSKILKSGHIKLYKRENSNYWQMKIKMPKVKAIRSSTGSKILKEAEKIALKYYSSYSSTTNIKLKRSKSIFKKIHLVETADLTKKEIEHILDESKKYISFNKKMISENKLNTVSSYILSVFKSNKIEYIAEILKNVKHDKKNFNNKIMISLLEEVGKSNFDFEVGEDEIKKSIEYYNRLIS